MDDSDNNHNPVLAIYGSLIALVNDYKCMKQRIDASKLQFVINIRNYLATLNLTNTISSKTMFILNLL